MPAVEPIYVEIGTLLMCHRHEKDLSQQYVGDLLGLTRTSVVNIEAGRQRIMLHTVCAIAAILGLEPGELVGKAHERVRARRMKTRRRA